uniref:Uncharacterized protein n=1 Tax=Megaselia scalaris TaxID=36166 RepID=T1GJ91_MEGSC
MRYRPRASTLAARSDYPPQQRNSGTWQKSLQKILYSTLSLGSCIDDLSQKSVFVDINSWSPSKESRLTLRKALVSLYAKELANFGDNKQTVLLPTACPNLGFNQCDIDLELQR